MAGLVAFRAAPSPILRWQAAAGSDSTGVSQVDAVLPNPPTPGRGKFTVAVFSVRKASAFSITAGPTGFTEVSDAAVADYIDAGSAVGTLKVYYRENQEGDSATASITTDVTVNWSYAILEFEGIGLDGVVADTENNDSVGVTTIDDVSVEAAISNMLSLGVVTTSDGSGVSNFAADDGSQLIAEANIANSNVPTLAIFEKMVPSAGTLDPDYTWSGSKRAAGSLMGIMSTLAGDVVTTLQSGLRLNTGLRIGI